jgi:hypothetical protein
MARHPTWLSVINLHHLITLPLSLIRPDENIPAVAGGPITGFQEPTANPRTRLIKPVATSHLFPAGN